MSFSLLPFPFGNLHCSYPLSIPPLYVGWGRVVEAAEITCLQIISQQNMNSHFCTRDTGRERERENCISTKGFRFQTGFVYCMKIRVISLGEEISVF